MANTSALMTASVGIITKTRRTVYCSTAAQSSNQKVSGR